MNIGKCLLEKGRRSGGVKVGIDGEGEGGGGGGSRLGFGRPGFEAILLCVSVFLMTSSSH